MATHMVRYRYTGNPLSLVIGRRSATCRTYALAHQVQDCQQVEAGGEHMDGYGGEVAGSGTAEQLLIAPRSSEVLHCLGNYGNFAGKNCDKFISFCIKNENLD
jgi:hypothetical protein